MIRGS